MSKLEQINAIVDRVYALDLEPMSAINEIAKVLDAPQVSPSTLSSCPSCLRGEQAVEVSP